MRCKFCDVELEEYYYEPPQPFVAGGRIRKDKIGLFCPKCGLLYYPWRDDIE